MVLQTVHIHGTFPHGLFKQEPSTGINRKKTTFLAVCSWVNHHIFECHSYQWKSSPFVYLSMKIEAHFLWWFNWSTDLKTLWTNNQVFRIYQLEWHSRDTQKIKVQNQFTPWDSPITQPREGYHFWKCHCTHTAIGYGSNSAQHQVVLLIEIGKHTSKSKFKYLNRIFWSCHHV